MGYHAKPLTKEMVERAMRFTRSNRAAARYCNCSYIHYKKWAKEYFGEDGRTLFEIHKNQCGKGIPKFLTGNKRNEFDVKDIIEGRISATSFNPEKLKYKMIEQGYLKEECYNCGFGERRVIDYKVPLILHFKDNNTTHYGLDNVEFLCYNCYFLYVGEVFNGNDMKQIETHLPINKTTEAIDFQLDEYHMQRLRELGLADKPREEGDDLNLISRL